MLIDSSSLRVHYTSQCAVFVPSLSKPFLPTHRVSQSLRRRQLQNASNDRQSHANDKSNPPVSFYASLRPFFAILPYTEIVSWLLWAACVRTTLRMTHMRQGIYPKFLSTFLCLDGRHDVSHLQDNSKEEAVLEPDEDWTVHFWAEAYCFWPMIRIL